MNTESLLMQSINLTIIGMTVVFTFLILLVCVMKGLALLAKVLEKYYPEPAPATAPTATTANNNTLVAIAIAAAKKFQSK